MHLLFERSGDKIAMFAHFKEYHGNHKKKNSEFIRFWGTLSQN